MSQIQELAAQSRPGTGKGPAYQTRQKGLIPAVIYGGGDVPENIARGPPSARAPRAHGHVPDDPFRARHLGQEDPRHSARHAARSGQRPSRPCRFHAPARRRRQSASPFPCASRARKSRPASSAAACSTSCATRWNCSARPTTSRPSSKAISRPSTSTTRCTSRRSSCPKASGPVIKDRDFTIASIVAPTSVIEEQRAAAAAAARPPRPRSRKLPPKAPHLPLRPVQPPNLARLPDQVLLPPRLPPRPRRSNGRPREATCAAMADTRSSHRRPGQSRRGICAQSPQCGLHGGRRHPRPLRSDRGRARFQGHLAEGTLGGRKIHLLKPMTYMNDSGLSVGPAMRFYKLPLSALVVIHDEIDLAAGQAQGQDRRRRCRQ